MYFMFTYKYCCSFQSYDGGFGMIPGSESHGELQNILIWLVDPLKKCKSKGIIDLHFIDTVSFCNIHTNSSFN
jgi:hypothetical protein